MLLVIVPLENTENDDIPLRDVDAVGDELTVIDNDAAIDGVDPVDVEGDVVAEVGPEALAIVE